MRMNKFLTKTLAAFLAASCALTPVSALAANTTTQYNPEVTTASGELKLGWKATDDANETWWKTEYSFTDWKEVSKEVYDAETDNDLKMSTNTDRSDWRAADKATYDAYFAQGGDDLAKKNGYTDYSVVDKATFDACKDDALKLKEIGLWNEVDKAAYDAETNSEAKKSETSDWKAATYEEWAAHAADMRQATPDGEFRKVSLEEYTGYAAKYPGYENILYKYEDVNNPETFKNWVYFSEQIIANEFNSDCSHTPGFVLVGEVKGNGQIEGATWDGKNDGIRYFNDDTINAQYVAQCALELLNANGVAYTTINSGSDIPKIFAQKSSGVNNGTVYVADKDFGIYYYAGSDTIEVQELFGILIAPNATVKIGGKWCGTIIADKVAAANNWQESTMWCYPEEKGTVDREYFVCNPKLEVKDIVYFVRTVVYKLRDYKYEVRDVVIKYFTRTVVEKKYYCKKSPYVPQTGDNLFMLYVLIAILGAGVACVAVSRKKGTKSTR